MTDYLSEELAGEDPIELYEFTFGTDVWRFTDGDGEYTHPITEDVYTPEMLSRGNLVQNDEDKSMSVDVTIDALNPVANFFRTPYLPGQQVWLVIYRTHRNSVNAPAVVFRGQVGQVVFQNTTAKLTCVPLRNALSRSLPVQLVQTLCTNALYDQRCKLDPELFKITGTITAIDGLTFTMDYADTGKDPGYFGGGFIQGADAPPATIKQDNVNKLEMLYNPGYTVGMLISIYAGCDKQVTTCVNKFANIANFQAAPYMPLLNPFADEIA